MESNGERGRIHLSQDTADLLVKAGKQKWVTPREDIIEAKGKGQMQTFWLATTAGGSDRHTASMHSSESGGTDEDEQDLGEEPEIVKKALKSSLDFMPTDAKTERLIQWNTECLLRHLKQIVGRRKYRVEKGLETEERTADESVFMDEGLMAVDEIQPVINLPQYDYSGVIDDFDKTEIDPIVAEQLKHYVSSIAAMYKNNPFHNFEHASHVAMSVTKLLSRINAPVENEFCKEENMTLHDHTYGVTSDPLTFFCCILCALIHDVDHQGVPNAQLVKENTACAQHYKGRSVAEQNSLDIAWNLLMDDTYTDLRKCLYSKHESLVRFRELLVNTVMATDIVDKDLKTLRNEKWALAFSESAGEANTKLDINRKATIVIEHIIQASDVSHMMQHWHIYRKWNERFFLECYKAYKEGRAEKNPADGWYEGEKGFYDFYIIPLAKKLKDCGVFGVSGDEYLNYALTNRKEWEVKGQEVVESMVNSAEQMSFESKTSVATD